jgi:hypothetical protein
MSILDLDRLGVCLLFVSDLVSVHICFWFSSLDGPLLIHVLSSCVQSSPISHFLFLYVSSILLFAYQHRPVLPQIVNMSDVLNDKTLLRNSYSYHSKL